MANRAETRWPLAIVELLAALAALALAALAFAGNAAAAPSWAAATLPQAGVFPNVPLGAPSDLSCHTVNRCLLATNGGNSGFGPSVFNFNGAAWKQYASVCGSNDPNAGRVVWGGPADFWLITDPSPPYTTRFQNQSLCHVVNGQVAGSYSEITELQSSDPFGVMNAGACLSATECWFAGPYTELSGGAREGAFHLRWNGTELTPVYAPQGRGVSDVAAFDGEFVESVYVGGARKNPILAFNLTVPESEPLLLHTIAAGGDDASAFTNVSFVPASVPGLPSGSTELYGLDTNGPASTADRIWAVGGGAMSGPGADSGNPADRGPFVATREVGGSWAEIPVPDGLFGPDEQFLDVAAIPGTDEAIATIVDGTVGWTGEGTYTEIAHLDADGVVTRELISANWGSIARIECLAADDCWAATTDGIVLHYTDPADPQPALDADPAFTTTITFRPNEVAEQAISDNPPLDDSNLFAPLPEDRQEEPEPEPAKRLKAAVQKIKTKLKGSRLVVTFRVIRKAKVTIEALRKRKVVAAVRTGYLRKGRHKLTLRLNPDRWPTRLKMKIAEPKSKSTAALPLGGQSNARGPLIDCAISGCRW